jgi:hypothetical protein
MTNVECRRTKEGRSSNFKRKTQPQSEQFSKTRVGVFLRSFVIRISFALRHFSPSPFVIFPPFFFLASQAIQHINQLPQPPRIAPVETEGDAR